MSAARQKYESAYQACKSTAPREQPALGGQCPPEKRSAGRLGRFCQQVTHACIERALRKPARPSEPAQPDGPPIGKHLIADIAGKVAVLPFGTRHDVIVIV